MIHLTLPYPPTVNQYWRRVIYNGKMRTYISNAGKGFARDVYLICHERSLVNRHIKRSLAITIKVVFPDRRKRDIDNLLKSTLDALQKAGVYIDDSQIKKINIEAIGVEKPGRLEMTIEAWNAP